MKIYCVITILVLILGSGWFQARPEQSSAAVQRVTFAEVAPSQSKISWVHDNGRSELRHLPETCGGGGLFFDFDNDGWMDIYLVNSGPSDFYSPKTPIKNALYRNNGDGSFTDVTDKAGVACGQMGNFGMGAAAADFDGDGWQDLYVTNYGTNVLFHNNGNGTFTNVTDKAGVAAPNWSTCATWFDYDNDQKLDLFVSSFVQYSGTGTIFCGDNKVGRRYYCVPRVFKPRSSFLFHNEGGGKFLDVSKDSGIAASLGKSFGAVATDVNNDGLMDLFVANDTLANFLFVNKGKGKFEETGLLSGVAYSDSGAPRSGMGVDATDYDNDGWQDLFVANIDQELFSLYHNEKDLTFIDRPGEIGPATRLLSGWGLRFFDYDNDGDPDLILANGHPDDMVEIQSLKVKYKEPLLMFENVNGTYRNVSMTSGAPFTKDWPARGLSVGDYDNDGDLDVLVINNGDAPVLLKNEGGNQNNWVGLNLVATKSNPMAVGAIITWEVGGVKYRRLKTAGGSYLSSHDPREVLGIGKATKIDSIEIKWPSGRVDKVTNPPIRKYMKIVEGSVQSVANKQ
ncbi:MAG TPA: CRTAC1 family protein [Pyrinomonadaceae bacterium]|nr:CRTAC1 family protein [Pyrinomonadaceae bacterium]